MLNSQFQSIRRDTRFQKSIAIVEACNPYSVDDGYENDKEEKITMTEWNWGKKTVKEPSPWGKGVEESYDFNVTKSDKLFDFLLEKGRSSCPIIMLCCPLIS